MLIIYVHHTQYIFIYLKFNIKYKQKQDKIKQLEHENGFYVSQKNDMQTKINELLIENNKFKQEQKKYENKINELENDKKEIEIENNKLKKEINILKLSNIRIDENKYEIGHQNNLHIGLLL